MLVCLDFDGVIVDSLEQQLDVVIRAQAAVGSGRIPVLRDFHNVENLSPLGFARHIEIPAADVPRWCEVVKREMANSTVATRLFPESCELIARIGAAHPLAIISSNVRGIIEAVLTENGIREHVQRIYDVEMPGTKADKIAQAVRDLGADPSSTVMVGDTRSDIRHAKEAGVKAIAITWGYQSRETLSLEKPDAVADTPAELLAFLGL